MGRFDSLIFSLSPLSEIFEGQISTPGIHKEFLEETVRYKVKGNKLIVTTYNKKGKLIEERSFKRLSEGDVKKLDYDYERDVRADKKLFQN